MFTLRIHGWGGAVFALGDVGIAERKKTAFLCSRNYPAGAVLRIYDWAKEARENRQCVISSFQSPLERDVLDILLRGEQPIVLATARGLPKRHPLGVRRALEENRLLIVSPFPTSVLRITAGTARKRNAFMLSVADRVVLGHVSQDSALAEVVRDIPPHKEIIRLDAS